MNKHVLIGKNVNYAASKASTTADTATSPELLKDGAIGFYLEDGTLIPAAGTGMSTAEKFFIAQGTADGCIVGPILDKRLTLKTKVTQDYTAPVKQVTHIGYNGSTGDLATPTIAENDEATIKIINTTGGRQVFPKQTYNAVLSASATDYEIALALVNEINSTAFATGTDDFAIANVISDGTHAEFDNNVTVTNGSATVTFATDSTYGGGATNLVVGDFIQLQGYLFEVTAVASATSVTIDREYTGATETIAVGSTVNAATRVTSITAYGVEIEAAQDGDHFRVAVGGVIEDATITYSTPFNPGSGTYAQIAKEEKDAAGASRGYWNRVGPYASYPEFTLFADSTATYDQWKVITTNAYKDKTGMGASIGQQMEVIVAVNSSATTVNTALDTITAAI
jgi:hypothetical protein